MTRIESSVFDRLDAVRSATHVGAVFGEPIRHDGVTVIPVAAVRGAAGGGTGTGPESGAGSGSGGGMGYALRARPVGVFVVRGTRVTWKPAVDVVRVLLAGQVTLIGLVVAVFLRRRRLDQMGGAR